MTIELLALIPDADGPAPEAPFQVVAAGGVWAVFVPALPRWHPGRALRRQRLERAAERQAWLEALMPHGTVLPVAPDTRLAPDETGALIAANEALIAHLAARLAGGVQYQVSLSWAEAEVLGRFRDAPEIAPLFAAGTVTGPALAGAVTRLAERLSGEAMARLSAVADEIAELPRDDGMLVNAVLLLPPARAAALDAVIEAIDALWPEGFRIRQIGPGPAASFGTLRLNRHGADAVARAHAELGLRQPATAAAIAAARKSALLERPGDAATIRHAARLACAALRTGGGPVPLLDLWAEGQALPPVLEDVA